MQWRHGFPVIDCHIHLPELAGVKPEMAAMLRLHPAFQELTALAASPEALLEYMDAEGVFQVWPIRYHARDTMGYGRTEAEATWRFCEADPDRLVAVGGYDPIHDGPAAPAVESMVAAGVRVLKIHPVHQGIDPYDRRLHALYDAAEEAELPIIFHTGPSVFPGANNQFADPGLLAPVLVDHPDLRVIMAHGGRPDRTDVACRLMDQSPNLYLDLSGCPPKRLDDYFGDLARWPGRVLWGTDWPGPKVPAMSSNIEAFMAGRSDALIRAVMHDNAARLLAG